MAIAVLLMVKAETKWLGTRKTSEWFYTAGRTIKTGLIASSIVSAWTWAATLLQSSTVTYQFGISGAFWYAAGASIQILLFSILAIELKRKAPGSHTFPEMLYVRYGKHPHKVFLSFALMTNTIVTAMLVLGGAAVINALTGINITTAAFLIPVGIIIYTVFGGLKATLFAEYMNTTFIFVVILIFVSVVYFSNSEIGGIAGMYEKLANAAILKPVDGNSMGSYLTLASLGALIFGIINIVGNFGSIFVDQSYWQRAIAARPKAASRGFVLGGLVWFAIPFTLATALGLGAIASGISLGANEVGLGLVAPAAAVHLMGDVGAILILSILFTAVIAAGSSQLISVSSLITYDVFRTYVNPSATGRSLIRISRYTILGFGLGMGLLASVLFKSGFSLNDVYLMMGVIIGSAVAPIAFGLLWKKTNRIAATAGAISGLVLGVSSWLYFAALQNGQITSASAGQVIPLLIGNVVSITTGLAVTIIGSLVSPDDFDFGKLKQKILVVDDKIRSMLQKDTDEKLLGRYVSFNKKVGLIIALILVVLWPLSLIVSNNVFSLESFRIWIWLAVSWCAGAAAVVIILPIIEARDSIGRIFYRISNPRLDDDLAQDSHSSDSQTHATKILVPVDGSVRSLKALNSATYMFRNQPNVRIYLLHVIDWSDDEEEMDNSMAAQILEEGKLVLKSIMVPKTLNQYRRIVKLGNPPLKIAEVADKLGIDVIVMGKKGLGNTKSDIGQTVQKVLSATTKPVVIIN